MVCDTPLPERIVTFARAVFSSLGIAGLEKSERDRRYVPIFPTSIHIRSPPPGLEHGFHVRRLRKQVDRLHAIDHISRAYERPDVARQGRRIACDVDDGRWRETRQLRRDVRRTAARWIEDDEIGAATTLALQEPV